PPVGARPPLREELAAADPAVGPERRAGAPFANRSTTARNAGTRDASRRFREARSRAAGAHHRCGPRGRSGEVLPQVRHAWLHSTRYTWPEEASLDDELQRLLREAEATPTDEGLALRVDQALRRAGRDEQRRARFRFKFECPLRFEDLRPGKDPLVRSCD